MRIAQAHGVELHEHEVADEFFGQVGVLAQRKRHVIEHRQVGEQRAKLEQHAHAPAQAVQPLRIEAVHDFAANADFATLGANLATDETQHRRLAATGSAHDSNELATWEIHAQIRQNGTLTVSKMQIADFD